MPTEDPRVTVVTMAFRARDPERLGALLAAYVVETRTEPGCRNVDLCASVTGPDRYLVIEKWVSPDAQRAHFDSPVMVRMAEGCRSLLAEPPHIDLLEGISAHDLT